MADLIICEYKKGKEKMTIPKDPVILLSFTNTKLRDFYPSLDELCKEMEIEKDCLTKKLAGIDYHYEPAVNQFI